MKKLLSFCLVVCIMLSTIPLTTFAADVCSNEENELLQLACETFPEFADSILHPVVPNPFTRASSNPAIVYTEARKASENICVIYSQYEDGTVFLTSVEGDGLEVSNSRSDLLDELDKPPATEITRDYVVTGQKTEQHTLNIKGTHPGVNGYFQISNFTYTIVYNGYDYINKTGEINCYNDWKGCSLYGTPVYKETSSNLAYAVFRATYQFGPGAYYSRQTELYIDVGKDCMTFSHVNFL